MATDTGGRRPAGSASARGALLAAVCSLLLVAAGCTSRPEPLPLMADSLLLKPVDRGRLSSAFGPRRHPILKRRMMHRGIDWAAPHGTPVRAAGHGMVSAQGPFGSYGRYLRIEHGGEVATAYAHLERFAPGLGPGQLVRQGELIGYVGSSGRAAGPHLHYELLLGGRQVDPLALAGRRRGAGTRQRRADPGGPARCARYDARADPDRRRAAPREVEGRTGGW